MTQQNAPPPSSGRCAWSGDTRCDLVELEIESPGLFGRDKQIERIAVSPAYAEALAEYKRLEARSSTALPIVILTVIAVSVLSLYAGHALPLLAGMIALPLLQLVFPLVPPALKGTMPIRTARRAVRAFSLVVSIVGLIVATRVLQGA